MILWSVKKETDIRRGRHCVFLMHVHLVFVTRYRRQIFDHDATEKLRTYFSNVCAYFEAELVEMDGEPDHVHLLINYPPKLAISSLVNSLKGVSSRLLRRDRPDIAVRYYDKGVLWSPGYFVSSCILTYQLDLITTISAPNRISNVISIPLIIPSTSCNFPTLELHIVQTPDAKKSHVHF